MHTELTRGFVELSKRLTSSVLQVGSKLDIRALECWAFISVARTCPVSGSPRLVGRRA